MKTSDVQKYMDLMSSVSMQHLRPGGYYSGKEGHERFAISVGCALPDFSPKEQKELLQSSYSTIYVRACDLKPLLNAKEWWQNLIIGKTRMERSQLKAKQLA